MAKKLEQKNTQTYTPLENLLAWGAVIFIGLSVLAFFTVLAIAALQSVRETPGGAFQAIAWVAYIGMPIGFLMLFTLLILNARKRRRAKTQN